MNHNISPEDARRTIEFVADRFPGSQEAQYIKVGKWFTREPLTAFERESLAIMLRNIHAFKPGECYMNAWKISQERDALIFCEGLAAGMWPVPHAWVSYKGRAIDVTWPVQWKQRFVYKSAINIETIMQRVEHNLKNCVYFGVEVPAEIIRDHALKQKTYSPLFDARFYKQWPEFTRLLQGKKFTATI